jgi:hypothetical protein
LAMTMPHDEPQNKSLAFNLFLAALSAPVSICTSVSYELVGFL